MREVQMDGKRKNDVGESVSRRCIFGISLAWSDGSVLTRCAMTPIPRLGVAGGDY